MSKLRLYVLLMLVWVLSGVVFDFFHECHANDAIFKDSFENNYSDCSTVTLTGQVWQWNNLFVSNFPLPTYQKKRVTIPEFGYYAVRFYTGNHVDDGYLSNIEAVGTTGWRLGALSVCEGKFEVPEACSYKWGDHGGINWNMGTPDPSMCNLEPNTYYYWNMTFTDIETGESRCAGSYCLTTLIPINN